MLFDDLPWLKKVFTPWSEPLEESLSLIESDLDMFIFISNFVIANSPSDEHWEFAACRKIVDRHYIEGVFSPSLELEFTSREHAYGVWNLVWLRGGALTWHQNIHQSSQLTGAEEIKAFIRGLHEQ